MNKAEGKIVDPLWWDQWFKDLHRLSPAAQVSAIHRTLGLLVIELGRTAVDSARETFIRGLCDRLVVEGHRAVEEAEVAASKSVLPS